MHGTIAGKTEQFIPTMFGSGCVLWLTARQGVTLDTGTDVATWADQTTYNNSAVTAVGAPPTYETSGANLINGLPALRFGVNGGGNTELTVADAASLKPTAAISISCVVRPQIGIDIFQVILIKTTDPSLSTDGWGIAGPENQSEEQGFYINDINTTFAKVTGLSINTNYIFTGIYTGASLDFYVNGTLAQSVPYSAPISYPGSSVLHIGHADAYNSFIGCMSELVICNFALSTFQRQQLERGYFGQLYGISA